MSVGDKATVTIEPQDAYGERRDDLIRDFPRNDDSDSITVGQVVQLANGLPATIVEITDETVRLDANHRLAGLTLIFEIEVVEIR